MSVNKAILIGNVGRDPEVRYLDKDLAVARFSLATTERGYTLQNGTVVPDRTEWHNIVAWRGLATVAEKYIKKGDPIYVEGRITTNAWEKDGIKRYTTEIVADNISMLGRKHDGSEKTEGAGEKKAVDDKKPLPIDELPPVEDDLPF